MEYSSLGNFWVQSVYSDHPMSIVLCSKHNGILVDVTCLRFASIRISPSLIALDNILVLFPG